MSQNVKKGDTVKIHYTGRFKDGQVFDSSVDRDPLEFEVGSGSIIKGLEKGIVGMKPGEKKEISVSPEEGYGNFDEKLLFDMPKEKIPADIKPEVGMRLQLVNNKGQTLPVLITEIKEEAVKIDANHPLAGKELVFNIELLQII